MEQANEQELKELLQEFLNKMGFAAKIEMNGFQDNTYFVRFVTADSGFLIGAKGEVLRDLQTIINKIARKKFGEEIYVDIDVNDYKEQKIHRLKEIARRTADEVALFNRAKEFADLSPFERRVIHMELKDRMDVVTESIGEKEERILIIKPAHNLGISL